jgi:general stress protein 26
MSNNRNVEWDGDTWFFAYADSSQAQETAREANVNLAYALPDEILFVAVTGRGEIVKDDAKKRELWYDDLKRWFPEGPDDNKVVLIKVVGKYVHYWSKEGDGELEL